MLEEREHSDLILKIEQINKVYKEKLRDSLTLQV